MLETFAKPDGYQEVPCSEFYRHIGHLNVHSCSEKSHSRWELASRQIVGYTTPGYICNGRRAYYLEIGMIDRHARKARQ